MRQSHLIEWIRPRRSSGSSASQPRAPTAFKDLHIELLRDILSYLPLVSAAALALTSRALLFKLGTRYFDKINDGQWECQESRFFVYSAYSHLPDEMTHERLVRQQFLILIDRDLADKIFCHSCQIIHNVHGVGDEWMRACRTANAVRLYYPKGFHVARVHLIMKLYRQGLAVESHMERLTRNFNKICYYGNHAVLRLGEARIMDGRLLVRSQFWILVPRDRCRKLPPNLGYLPVCHHLFYSPTMPEENLGELFGCQLSHYKRGHSCRCLGLKPCTPCPTEYRVDCKDMGKRGVAVVLTVWQTFGRGATPYALDWVSHFRDISYYNGMDEYEMSHGLGTVQAAFEGLGPSDREEFKFDSIITRKARRMLKVHSPESVAKIPTRRPMVIIYPEPGDDKTDELDEEPRLVLQVEGEGVIPTIRMSASKGVQDLPGR